ncbi:hypothetical protein C6Y50_20690 [Stutzerimonas stutzeri]|nr:hypothetical protein [Stutzerimonas stutzeri]AWL02249.1 hypothetical protein C6Y50_20690 [Stutzerimonas stutzeri]
MLDDRRFVEYDPDKARAVKLVDAVVVHDVDAGANVLRLAAVGNLHPDALALGDCLRGNRERRKDHHIAARAARYFVSPCNLHAALAKPSVCKYRRAATAQCPSNQIALHIKQRFRQGERLSEARWRERFQLARYEFLIAHAYLQAIRRLAAIAAGGKVVGLCGFALPVIAAAFWLDQADRLSQGALYAPPHLVEPVNDRGVVDSGASLPFPQVERLAGEGQHSHLWLDDQGGLRQPVRPLYAALEFNPYALTVATERVMADADDLRG